MPYERQERIQRSAQSTSVAAACMFAIDARCGTAMRLRFPLFIGTPFRLRSVKKAAAYSRPSIAMPFDMTSGSIPWGHIACSMKHAPRHTLDKLRVVRR